MPVMQLRPQMSAPSRRSRSPQRKLELEHILLRAVISLGPVLNQKKMLSLHFMVDDKSAADAKILTSYEQQPSSQKVLKEIKKHLLAELLIPKATL